ncbi:MAG: metallophosphoesterase [Verrucomicrobia bacterium]|nr:metallophosphoesterase [Verrucomicrobiota bacterium]
MIAKQASAQTPRRRVLRNIGRRAASPATVPQAGPGCPGSVALNISRRGFLLRAALLPAAFGWADWLQAAGTPRRARFGLIADVHQDVMPDGPERLAAFVAAMTRARVDFIIQLGDFCQPHPRNRPFLEVWRRFPGPRHHVLGNHDMDGGYRREQTAEFYGMPAPHYAFDAGPIRGIVLDGNEPGGKAGGYARYVGPAQQTWLRRQLEAADRPVVLFIHQPFDADNDGCLENAAEIRTILETAQRRRPGLILAVFAGHWHLDYERVVGGVRYLEINSASYWWLANPAARGETFPPEVHRTHPYLKCVAAYRDPLWATATFDFERREFLLEGRRSSWVGPNPWERGEKTSWTKAELHPWISDRRAPLPPPSGLLKKPQGTLNTTS